MGFEGVVDGRLESKGGFWTSYDPPFMAPKVHFSYTHSLRGREKKRSIEVYTSSNTSIYVYTNLPFHFFWQ